MKSTKSTRIFLKNKQKNPCKACAIIIIQNWSIVAILLQRFFFIFFYLQDGNIPLFAAIEAGNLHVCRELLMQETEAQVKYTKPPLKDTGLHLAARRKDNDMVKLFIEAGAGVDVQNVRWFLLSKVEVGYNIDVFNVGASPTHIQNI